MLSSFLARIEYFKSLDKKYLTDKGNFSKITESLQEVDRKHREATSEIRKAVKEDCFRDADLNTKKD